MKCLAKEPTQRYASVAELAEQLLPFAPEWHLVVERATRLLGGGARSRVVSTLLRSIVESSRRFERFPRRGFRHLT